jgi:hypothetical protein
MYVEHGTKPRIMRELEGKIIPMGGGRFVRAVGVGKPGFVTLPGGVKVWRDQKWRHPGIKPQHFMQDSVEEALREYLPAIQRFAKSILTGQTSKGELE